MCFLGLKPNYTQEDFFRSVEETKDQLICVLNLVQNRGLLS